MAVALTAVPLNLDQYTTHPQLVDLFRTTVICIILLIDFTLMMLFLLVDTRAFPNTQDQLRFLLCGTTTRFLLEIVFLMLLYDP